MDGPHGPAHDRRPDLREFDGDAGLSAPEDAGSALARWLLGLGIAATLAANVAHGLGHGLIGAAVAAWPAVALVGSYELLMMVIRGSQASVKDTSETETRRGPAAAAGSRVVRRASRGGPNSLVARSALSSMSASLVRNGYVTTSRQPRGDSPAISPHSGRLARITAAAQDVTR